MRYNNEGARACGFLWLIFDPLPLYSISFQCEAGLIKCLLKMEINNETKDSFCPQFYSFLTYILAYWWPIYAQALCTSQRINKSLNGTDGRAPDRRIEGVNCPCCRETQKYFPSLKMIRSSKFIVKRLYSIHYSTSLHWIKTSSQTLTLVTSWMSSSDTSSG